ncbi:hypothetical protein [Streptomyces niveus]|uniref:hypothetical protein n=1 Tax=Streptomyces niveus TaxID=193462 RepID=UPI00114C8C83|nr:hypothetical protein [Streptomyces niveus]
MREEQTERAAPLVWKGVNYDTGTDYSGRGSAPPPWPDEVAAGHMALIREELHANSVTVFGTDVERLAAYPGFAAEAGLHVWLQPRLSEGDADATLAHLAAAAEAAAAEAAAASTSSARTTTGWRTTPSSTRTVCTPVWTTESRS